MKTLLWILAIIGLFSAAFGTVIAIVYAIYLFGAVGMAAGASLWGGAKLWLIMVPGGLLVGLPSYFAVLHK